MNIIFVGYHKKRNWSDYPHEKLTKTLPNLGMHTTYLLFVWNDDDDVDDDDNDDDRVMMMAMIMMLVIMMMIMMTMMMMMY